MSLWTPGGEHPVDRGGAGASGGPGGPAGGPGAPGGPSPMGGDDLTPEQEAEARQIAAEMQQVRDQLSQVPAAVVIANHAMGCYELAAIHLSSEPPKLDEAKLAIDAFSSLVEAVQGRLGPDEATLQDALSQLRLAFVQVKAAEDAGQPGTEGGAPDA